MVSWVEKEELVSYDEIDKAIELYKNNLMEYCTRFGANELRLDGEYVRYLAGCIYALKQLKTNHTKEWEASIPPDPLRCRIP